MKRCCTCKQTLPFEVFGKNKSKPDGLNLNCKPCKAIQSKRERSKNKDRISKTNKAYQSKNKEKIAENKREYYLNDRAKFIARACQYSKENREKCNAWSRSVKGRLKEFVFSHYSGGDIECKHCGEKEIDVLSLDHIYDDGAEHRKLNNIAAGSQTYRWAKANNFPDGLQVLCMNCQFKKRFNLIEMPTKAQQQRTRARVKLKQQCLDHYGGTCPCGMTDFDVLSLDHVNNDGAEHRKELNRWGLNFYIYLRQNNYPNNVPLQVLCMNCQFRKRAEFYQNQ